MGPDVIHTFLPAGRGASDAHIVELFSRIAQEPPAVPPHPFAHELTNITEGKGPGGSSLTLKEGYPSPYK